MNSDSFNLVKKTDKNRVKSPAEKISDYVIAGGAVAEILLAVLNRFTEVAYWLYCIFGYVVILGLIVNTASRTDKNRLVRHFTIAMYIICLLALTGILFFA